MFQRGISRDDVESVIRKGEVIENYPEDFPYPSRLMLGWKGKRPIHLVVAENRAKKERVIVTAYEPARDHWEAGFKKRRKR